MNKITIKNKIIKARDSYYNDSISLMTDAEYDNLVDELRSIDPNDELLLDVGSKVKATAWVKAKHKFQMYSLNKVNTEEEFFKWTENFPPKTRYVMEPKYDGLTMDLKYVKGKLVQAITRGDGIEGEDVTINVLKMKSIPKVLTYDWDCNINSELILYHTNLNKINKILTSEGKKNLSNPRNAASGIIRKLDGRFVEYLTFVAYGFKSDSITLETEGEVLFNLQDFNKYPVINPLVVEGCLTDIIEKFKIYETKERALLDFDIDGVVIKVNDLDLQNKAGLIQGNPKGQIAWKFAPMKVTTTVTGIEASNGKNGRITPVALLDPVRMGGVTVSRASVHNLSILNILGLRKGCKVEVSRRNDVIPYIEKNLGGGRELLVMPIKCPSCGADTEIDGEFMVCPNEACPARDIGTIMKWVEAANIMNLGESTVEKMYLIGLVRDPSDLYTLARLEFENLVGEKIAAKVILEIENNKSIALPKFIDGLNITHFGEGLTKILVRNGFDTIDKIRAIKLSDLDNVAGIKDKTANRIVDGLKARSRLIDKLLKHITIKTGTKGTTVNKIFGKSFCFTGGLVATNPDGSPITRKQAWEKVEEAGGIIFKDVKKGLNYLVQADPTSVSNKTRDAIKNGAEIIDENQFWKMLK